MRSNFSIVFQGRFDKSAVPNILHATRFSSDVIACVWSGSIDVNSAQRLRLANVRILEIEDPGSIPSYKEDGISKTLNVKRMFVGLAAGVAVARFERIIKNRLDVQINYQAFFQLWLDSGRPLASLNITTTCPHRLFAYPYLYCVSDWCFAFERSLFPMAVVGELNEQRLKRTSPLQIKRMEWFTTLGAEQVVALVMSGLTNAIYTRSNAKRFDTYEKPDLELSEHVLSQYCNVDRAHVDFKSTKYWAWGNRWTMYDEHDFSDSGFLKPAPMQFLLFIASQMRRIIKNIGARLFWGVVR